MPSEIKVRVLSEIDWGGRCASRRHRDVERRTLENVGNLCLVRGWRTIRIYGLGLGNLCLFTVDGLGLGIVICVLLSAVRLGRPFGNRASRASIRESCV
jgi:hypothetical protein